MQENFLTLQDISRTLKVAYLTVYRWIKKGKLNAYKVEKQYRISKTDFDEFLNNKKIVGGKNEK